MCLNHEDSELGENPPKLFLLGQSSLENKRSPGCSVRSKTHSLAKCVNMQRVAMRKEFPTKQIEISKIQITNLLRFFQPIRFYCT